MSGGERLFSAALSHSSGAQGCSEGQEEVPSPTAETVEPIPGSQLLWRIAPRPTNSTQVRLSNLGAFIYVQIRSSLNYTENSLTLQMYSFTSFAMQLNELRKEMEGAIPQTDCRLRPDIRAMENGDIGADRL